MTGLWWLLLGLLGGWLIELAIDYGWWRKRHRALQSEIAGQRGELERDREAIAAREAQASHREQELGERETVLNGRDADLMAQAKRIDERGEAITRSEQRLDSWRADLDRQASTLADRERDIAQRHQVLRDGEVKYNERNDRLVAAEADADKRHSMLASRESGLTKWEQRVLAKEKDVNRREAEATRLARDAERWRRHFHGMRALIDDHYRNSDGTDDLKVIHGVGRSGEKLLRSLGIVTFSRLAEAPLGELSRVAERGGADLALADPMSWAEQAQRLAERDYIGFENLKARLRGDIPPEGAVVTEIFEPEGYDSADGDGPMAVAAVEARDAVEADASGEAAEPSESDESGEADESGEPVDLSATEAIAEPDADNAAAGRSDHEETDPRISAEAAARVSRAALEEATREAGVREGGVTGPIPVGHREIVPPKESQDEPAIMEAEQGDGESNRGRRQERFAFVGQPPSRGGGRRRRR